MKKRILSIVLSLALVCTLLPQAFLPARAVTKQDVCMDDYAEPLGTNYTVHFSVPAGVTKPADMVSNTDTGITLPTVEGPEGYTFLGWVVSDYDNVETRPANILTGNYIATQEITLKALFTYSDDGPRLKLMTVNDTFAEGDKVVITAAGTEFGLYRQRHTYNHVKNFTFTNDAEAILADPLTYFPVTRADVGWYLGDNTNGWLYTPANQTNLSIKADNSNFMSSFELAVYEDHLVLQDTVDYNPSVFYLSCETDISGINKDQWAMVNTNNITGVVTLDIYKLDEGGTAVTFYTTEIAHDHVAGEPVTENNVEPTCTAVGGYDTVVYCTVCGEEMSRAHTEVAALGHLAGEAVEENRVEPTATTDGGYDTVVYCQRCGAEMSRAHTVLPATGTSLELTINNTLSLEGATTLNYFVKKTDLDAYGLDSFKIVVVHTAYENGDYTDETVELTAKNELYSGAYYWFEYTDIAAKELNDRMVAHVEGVKDGVTFTSATKDYNPMSYCYSAAAADSTAPATLQHTAADMIKYAAAAQTYFNYNTANMADANWDLVSANATAGDPTLTNHKKDTALAGQTATIKSNTLSAAGRVEINYYILPDSGVSKDDLTLVCTYTDKDGSPRTVEIPGTEWTLYNNVMGYKADLNTMAAAEMRRVVTAVVKDANGNVISNTYETSIETYAQTVVASEGTANAAPANLIALMKAMLNYGISAETFFNVQ